MWFEYIAQLVSLSILSISNIITKNMFLNSRQTTSNWCKNDLNYCLNQIISDPMNAKSYSCNDLILNHSHFVTESGFDTSSHYRRVTRGEKTTVPRKISVYAPVL